MSPFSLSIVFLFFFFFFFSTFQITEAKKYSLIQKTCNKSAEEDPNISYNFCLTSLLSAKHSRRCSDIRHLGLISIRLIHRNVTSTRRHIRKLLKKKSLDPFVKSCLADCEELYSEAIPTLKKARKDYKKKRYGDANVEISAVMEDSTTCEDGFGEGEGEGKEVVSPLTKRNHDTFELSAIALSIMNMLVLF